MNGSFFSIIMRTNRKNEMKMGAIKEIGTFITQLLDIGLNWGFFVKDFFLSSSVQS